MSIVSALIVAVLFGAGVYLMLQRTLSRIILGLALLGHAANLLLMVVGGRAGRAPIIGGFAEGLALARALRVRPPAAADGRSLPSGPLRLPAQRDLGRWPAGSHG